MLSNAVSILETASKVLRKYPLCDHCLGRLFAKTGFGMTNEERGRAIKNCLHMAIHQGILDKGQTQESIETLRALALSGHEPSIKLLNTIGIQVNPTTCYICGNTLKNMNAWVEVVINKLRSMDVEFNTLRLGTKIPNEILKRELNITMEFNIKTAESIKREINREVGKKVIESLGKGFSRDKPDIEVVIDIANGNVEVKPLPIYILAKYRKNQRINVTGKIPIDVLKGLYRADDVIIHWVLRDRARVRVFGDGKPVIIQIISPRRRPRADDVMAKINNQYVNIASVVPISKSGLIKVKTNVRSSTAVYRVLAITKDPINPEAIPSLVNYFRNRQINQVIKIGRKTKRKVSMVYEINATLITQNTLELLIKCQGNLNVSGFIHGHWGNVEPSISGVLGTETKPIEIDLINYYFQPP